MFLVAGLRVFGWCAHKRKLFGLRVECGSGIASVAGLAGAMNVLDAHSLRSDSRIGLAKMEGLLNSVLAELQTQSVKVKQLEQQLSKVGTPRAGR